MKAGVVDAKKAKKIGKEKRKKAKQAKHTGEVTEDQAIKQAAAEALRQKMEKDKAEAAERNKIEEQKQIAAQIKQLITVNKIDSQKGDTAYQFVDNKKVKKIYITQQQQRQLLAGMLAIVALGDAFVLVPTKVAEKIAERDDSVVKVLIDPKDVEEIEEDDPYADFQIPDDLMW